MTQPIAASQPLLTARNLAVAVTLIAAALLLWLVVARTGQSAQAATQVHHFYHRPPLVPILAPVGPGHYQGIYRAGLRPPPPSAVQAAGNGRESGRSRATSRIAQIRCSPSNAPE